MSGRNRRVRLALFAAAAVLGLAACATHRTPTPAPQPPVTPAALDPSYDWHVLLTAPFGTLLKDLPVAVHEVLLFRDESHNPPPAEDAECYAADASAPRFISRPPDEHLLCFKHDRLARVEATVRLPESEAANVFADACALWMKNAAVARLGAPATAAQPSGELCEGSDGSISYSGRLDQESDQDEAVLSVTLNASDRD
jgi:hypothetical protein